MQNSNQKIVEEYLKFYNSKNIESMIELFTNEIQFESISNSAGITKANNKEQLYELAKKSTEFFEERKQEVIHWVIAENKIAIEIEFWCRLAKDFPNGKKAGEGMRLLGASFFTFENGKISRLADYL